MAKVYSTLRFKLGLDAHAKKGGDGYESATQNATQMILLITRINTSIGNKRIKRDG
jgi:hypothetical protein